MALYDRIGVNYVQTRKSDPRIAAKLIEILNPSTNSIIADVGAGAGSYSSILADRGYRVIAIEPSIIMRKQSISRQSSYLTIDWINAYAEKIPLSDRSADAAIIVLAIHHFQNYQKALQEISRIIGDGQLIIFTYNPELISSFWLTRYFPSLIADVKSTFLPLPKLKSVIESITGKSVTVCPFPLPNDLLDSFAAVGWSRPDLYLDANIRNGISSFTKIADNELNSGLTNLEEDLKTGIWEQNYGYLRHQQEYDVGYCFLYTD